MSIEPCSWDEPTAVAQREWTLAKHFLGERYVLTILAEIHPGFRPIVDAHTDLFFEEREWKPIIYKIVSSKGDIAHLIGTIHAEIVAFPSFEKICKGFDYFPGNGIPFDRPTTLSSQVRNILINAQAVALEVIDTEGCSQSFRKKLNQLLDSQPEAIELEPSTKKKLSEKRAWIVKEGVEHHMKSFLFQERVTKTNTPPHLISLESEDIQLSAIEEFLPHMIPGIESDLALLDLSIEGNEEGFDHVFSQHSFMNNPDSTHVGRNQQMAAATLEIMQAHHNVVVAVGTLHLLGSYGMVSILQKNPDLTVIRLIHEEAAGMPSYNPNIAMTFADRPKFGDPPKDRHLWHSP